MKMTTESCEKKLQAAKKSLFSPENATKKPSNEASLASPYSVQAFIWPYWPWSSYWTKTPIHQENKAQKNCENGKGDQPQTGRKQKKSKGKIL